MYYGDLDDGRALCSWRQVARSVVIAIFSAKKGGQAGVRNDMIVIHKCESFVFPELILFQDINLVSGLQSCFMIWV